MKVEEISAVLDILKDLAAPQSIIRIGQEKMLDIEKQVKEKLEQIKRKYKHP